VSVNITCKYGGKPHKKSRFEVVDVWVRHTRRFRIVWSCTRSARLPVLPCYALLPNIPSEFLPHTHTGRACVSVAAKQASALPRAMSTTVKSTYSRLQARGETRTLRRRRRRSRKCNRSWTARGGINRIDQHRAQCRRRTVFPNWRLCCQDSAS
jgi:hypothetical protein